MTRTVRRALLGALLLFLSPVSHGQSGHAELTGEVRDPTGAVVAGATVVATVAETGTGVTAKASAAGLYNFPHLKPGRYSLKAFAPGFRTSARQDVALATGDRARIDFDLQVGAVEDTVNVESGAPLLDTETSTLGQVVDNKRVVTLPLNGRNFITLAGLAVGVALPPNSAFPRINGGRPRTNEYLFDGISVLQPEPGQVAFLPVIDSIQEFKVESNNAPAEFGRFNGGVVNLTMKSGTNEFHSSVFEFLRNEALNARNYFAPPDGKKPEFRRNQFGFVLGGPIVRDKTFFFVDYQGTRQAVGQVRISTVPTDLQRQGIFTEPVNGVVPTIYDPSTTVPNGMGGFTRTQFAGNTIPVARFDNVALSLLDRFPHANLPGTVNNYRRVANELDTQNQFDIRLDHRFSGADLIYGRFSEFYDTADPASPLPDGSGTLSSGVIGHTETHAISVMSHYLHTFSPSTVNELGFGYTRRSLTRSSVTVDAPPSISLGLPGIPDNAAFETALPTFTISGFQQIGPPANTFSEFRTDVTQLTDSLSFSKGRHNLKAGLDFRWERLDVTQPPSPTGLFSFNTLFTDLPGTPGTGFSFASFLLGQVNQFSIDLQEKIIRPRARIMEFFFQDDWKVTRRLTVSAGVRYTLNFPSTEVDDQGAIFNLDKEQLDYLGKNGYPRTARELHWGDFGPRVGFAWQLSDKTVLRSGYGIIWIEQAGITTPFTIPQFPFLQTVSQRTLNNINPAFQLEDGPSVAPIAPVPDAGLGQGVFGVDRSVGSGYAQNWNLSLQRQLTSTMSFELAYVGNKITHLGVPDVNLNQLTVEQLALGPALLTKVPNPFFGQIPVSSSIGGPTITQAQLMKPHPRFTTVSLYRDNVGNSSYNAFTAKFEKRFSHGLSLLASYTRSKLIDDASSVFDASVLTGPVANYPVADSFNRRLERNLSSGDIPNVFSLSYNYEFPVGRGHRWNPTGALGKIAAGWSMSGILTLQSGLPLAVTQATNFNAFAGFGTQRPNLVGEPNLPAEERSPARWFDTSAFSIAPQFTLGSSSRNPVRGPEYHNFDFALLKVTSLTERVALELRTEIFNLANIPALGAPATVLGNPGFGAITSAGDPRVIQLGAKLNF